eukprot:TRINITY_DN9026_c1_g1_i2.p1 TRINITY_DN9026_c1_g1~~TRINITY_DN9026_c1_g1_i2.p1  ORF type:complete len:195 (-),score=45.13 TRINITY_DN9026_c1_g1_i2:230-814(-)
MMSAFTMGNGQIAMLVLGLATCAFGADPDLPIYQEGKPGYVHFDLATGGSWFVSNSLCPCLISYTLTAFNPAIDPQINVYVLNQDNFDLYKSGARFQYYQAASSANSNFTQLDAWTSPSDVKYVVINRNPGPGLTEIKGTLKFATNVINAAPWWLILLIVVSSVFIISGVIAVVVYCIKKRRNPYRHYHFVPQL